MRWFNDSKMNLKNTFIPFELYSIDDEICDEILVKEDGFYVMKRCGEKPFVLNHGYEKYKSDGKRLIYPLPPNEYQEIKLDWIPPNTFGGISKLVFSSDVVPHFNAKVDVDRRYIEYRRYSKNKTIELNVSELNPDRRIVLTEICGSDISESLGSTIQINLTNDLAGDPTVINIELPSPLKATEKLIWNQASEKYEIRDSVYEIVSILEVPQITLGYIDAFILTSQLDIEISVPYKILRELQTPSNFNIIIDNDLCMISWDHVIGAESYDVFLNGELLTNTEYNGYFSREEYEGYVSVKAKNAFKESLPTEEIYVKSLPNEPFLSFIDNVYENKMHKIKVNFSDLSDMETLYRVRWSVDGRQEQWIDLDGKDGTGSIYTHTLEIANITDRVEIRVNAVNEIGENEIVRPVMLFIPPTPLWTYNESTKTVLIDWQHKIDTASRYRVRYSVDGGEFNVDDVAIEVDVGSSMKHYIDLEPDSEMVFSVAPIVDEKLNIYTPTITMSKALDTTLIAPVLTSSKVSETEYEFSWIDTYTNENEFEVSYSLNGGEVFKETVKTMSEQNTGRRYYFSYTFPEHGFLKVEVRMIWDLGYSAMSNPITVYYVPASGLPPAYLRKEYVNEGIKFTWEGQEYVKDYEIDLVVGSKHDKIKNLIDNFYIYPFKQNATSEPKEDFELGKWQLDMYPKDKYIGSPDKAWIEDLEIRRTMYLEDRYLDSNTHKDTEYIGHGWTYVYCDEAFQLVTKADTDDEGCVYLNDEKILPYVTSWRDITFNFKAGWNKIEVIYNEGGGNDGFMFEVTLSAQEKILMLTHDTKIMGARHDSIEAKVKTNFLNGVISDYSKVIKFTPEITSFDYLSYHSDLFRHEEILHTKNVEFKSRNEYIYDTRNSSITSHSELVNSMIMTLYTLESFPYSTEFTGKGLRTPYTFVGQIIQGESRQSEYPYIDTSIMNTSLDLRIGTYVETLYMLENKIYTEINRVRIMTIGDSITSGHPGFWAETMTGDITSQYQYWLDRRLKGQYEIINKGYGSDTTDRMLKRFNDAVQNSNATYCILQCGTNDLYWDENCPTH